MFKVISDIKAHWYEMINTLIIRIICCNAKKMNCPFMFSISNHYGKNCHTILLHLEPSSDMLKVISDQMTHWYEMIITIIITINFCNA